MSKPIRRTVLCIGNDAVHLNLRSSLLKEHGWHVLSSASGNDGVKQFTQTVVDAVILDLNHNGSESALFAGELKRLRPAVKIIILISNRADLLPGATDLADAVIMKAEEARNLPDTLRSLVG